MKKHDFIDCFKKIINYVNLIGTNHTSKSAIHSKSHIFWGFSVIM